MAINFTSDILSLYTTNVATEAAYQSPGTYDLPEAGIMGGLTAVTAGAAGSNFTNRPTVSFATTYGSGGAANAILTGTSVASYQVTTPGSYAAIPTVTVGGVTAYGGSGATATARMGAVDADLEDGGSGYAENDTITLTGGTFSQAAVITVDTVDGGGAILTFTITTPGVYSVLPTNPVAQGSTSGGGSNAEFNITGWGVVSLVVGAGGTLYTGRPDVAFSGSGGAVANSVLTATTVASYEITEEGQYSRAPVVTVSGGGGTGATATSSISNAEESKILMLIEVFRAYIATTASASELKSTHEVLTRMLAALPLGGGSTFNASTIASRAQAAAVRLYAKQNRPDY